MGASASGLEGTGVGASRRSTTLGPERKGFGSIPIRAWKYGQESFLDVLAGRRLLQSAAGRDGRRTGDAPESTGNGQSEEYSAANGNDGWFRRGDCASATGRCLCPRLQPLAGLWVSHRGLAGLVPLSRNLVWRSLPFLRPRIWHWLVRRLWVGLGPLGV